MKRLFPWFNSSTALILVILMTQSSCSSTQSQQSAEEQVNGLDQNESVNATLNDSGGSQNQNQPEQSNQFANQGESMNNVPEEGGNNFGGNTGNVFSNTSGANPSLQGSNLGLTNAPINQMAPVENTAIANSVPTNTIPVNGANAALNSAIPINGAVNTAAEPPTEAPPTNAANLSEAPVLAPASPSAPVIDWEKMNKSPFQNPNMNWPGRGKVKYITRRVTKHASPNGPVLGEFNVGNHPLVYQNGNWTEISNGTYIRGNAASDRPVGYPKRSSVFAH